MIKMDKISTPFSKIVGDDEMWAKKLIESPESVDMSLVWKLKGRQAKF